MVGWRSGSTPITSNAVMSRHRQDKVFRLSLFHSLVRYVLRRFQARPLTRQKPLDPSSLVVITTDCCCPLLQSVTYMVTAGLSL